ncbi:hypothetical protein C5F50_09055 [Nitrosopumilus ureiphilus]|uniref:Uncharacterized protein n=1 Tax=Nitrosopumilus ureiphilus TaxID=1470067 RepID=A0A7D5M940_9ARCH|nr:hypothetical protein C5F50_09055 [Nitrosopumilus ureiphilus]
MKKKCVDCGKRFNRIDVWAVEKTRFKKKYVCRNCFTFHMKQLNPHHSDSRDLGLCSTYRPPQWFTDHSNYIDHHHSHH